MFTGIIEAKGEVVDMDKKGSEYLLKISLPDSWQVDIGDSINVDGACLTVAEKRENIYTFRLMKETVERTKLSNDKSSEVNLERAMPVHGRFNGHIVQGHVDGVGIIESIKKGGTGAVMTIRYSNNESSLIVPKGSITIDGVSLTVMEVDGKEFTVSLVEYTIDNTTLGNKKEGDQVNIEYDVIGKYVQASINNQI